jgi:hypothetical protein
MKLEEPDMTDDPTHDHATDAPLNREQRRAARYRPKAGLPDPHAVGGPVADETAGAGGDDDGSLARSSSGEVTKETGAGSGGATESDERLPHTEASHFGNRPNG